MNLRNLLGKQKIVDMSRVSKNSKKKDSTKWDIDSFFKKRALNNNVQWSYTDDYRINVDGNLTLNMQGLEEFPSYINFNEINGDFTLNVVNVLKNTYGFPNRIIGDFTINGDNKLSGFDTKNFPEYVKGTVHFHNCKYVSDENLDEFGSFIRDSVEEYEIELSQEQQEVLDFASNVLSEEEYNALEDFFYGQNE